jgi:hypothetical protein
VKVRAHVKHFGGELNDYLGGSLFPLGLFYSTAIRSIPQVIISPKNIKNYKSKHFYRFDIPQLNVHEFLKFSMANNEGLELTEINNLMGMWGSEDKNSRKLAKTILAKCLSFSNIAEVNYRLHNYMINNLRIRSNSLEFFNKIERVEQL